MKVAVLGTRGMPDIPGGVESHCQALYPKLVDMGCDITLITRKPYVTDPAQDSYRGVKLKHIHAPKNKGLEAIIHTFLGVCYARLISPDVLHIHAIGPALLTPFARLLGLKVVVTNHGPDYDRQKWGKLASFILKTGEKLGGIFANKVIVISEVISEIIAVRCHRDSHLIYNGVTIPSIASNHSYLEQLAVNPGNYLLAVARFVPEKGLHDLIEAFNNSSIDADLVIAGDADHEDEYSKRLKAAAASNPRIKLTGYITGNELHQVFSHAKLFVLPSYHEGLPIALLEALSYGLPSLVSDIPANLEVKLDDRFYFETANTTALQSKIETLWNLEFDSSNKEQLREFVRKKYNWDDIAKQTLSLYQQMTNKNIKLIKDEQNHELHN
jgi:glycosyltransferase involved in cell wall biosynthesis